MKPDWKEAPEFANYLAMDKDFTWCFYEKKPCIYEEEEYWNNCKSGIYTIIPNKIDWRKTLEKRQKDKI